MESHQVHGQRPQPTPNQSPSSLPPSSPNIDPAGKRNIKTAILITLVVLLALAVGVLSYFLLNEEKATTNNDTQLPAVSQQDEEEQEENKTEEIKSETPPADPTAGWKTLSSGTYGISFKHPAEKDWTANVTDGALTSGQKATGSVKFIPCGPNCGWALSLKVATKGSSDDPGITYGEKQLQGNSYYKLVSKKNVTRSGSNGIRWEHTPADDKAASIVYYYFTNDDLAYTFEVNMNGSKTDAVDITKTGEMIMDTLTFKAQ